MADPFFGITDTGRQRSNNEDTFLAQRLARGRYIAACVIDGVGGYEGGEVAAAIARDTVKEMLEGAPECNTVLLRKAVELANNRIYQEKQRSGNHPHMSCVLTLAVVERKANRIYYAHVGDTRLYLFRDRSLVKLTRDHSFVGLLEDSGRISEREAMNHPKRNEIDKALGFYPSLPQPDQYIETGESPFLPGDLLMLCSDGLTDLVDKDSMIAVLDGEGSLKQKALQLVDAANEQGGKDNITVVLVLNPKAPATFKPVEPRRERTTPIPAVVAEEEIWEEEDYVPEKSPARSGKKTSWIWIGAGILLLLLLGILLWLRPWQGAEEEQVNPEATRSMDALQLQDTLNRQKEAFYFDPAVFTDTITLDDTVWIYRDSLTIRGHEQTVLTVTDPSALIQVAPSINRLSFARMEFYKMNLKVSSNSMQHIYLDSVRLRQVSLGVGDPVLVQDTVYSGRLSSLYSSLQKKAKRR